MDTPVRPRRRLRQQGFTLVEVIVTTAILAILASVAIKEMRDYSRRASLSEVVMALNSCKNQIAENYLLLDEPPDAGTWGCERSGGSGRFAGSIQTSENGVVRVGIRNLDAVMNGHYVYLVPARGANAMVAADDLGRGVSAWICGSDWMMVRNALPASCRADTTTFASQDFQ